MAEVLEHVIIELIGVVDVDLSRDTVAGDDILPEEFMDSRKAYFCDGLPLDPFCEVLKCYNSEGVVALSWSQLANYVNAPSLEMSRWSDYL
jgi:hypothetical protein